MRLQVLLATAACCALLAGPALGLTLSGTITGPDGAVADATVVGWVLGGEADQTTSDGSGHYALTLSEGQLFLRVEPPLASHLATRWFDLGVHASSFVEDVTVVAGYLLEGRVEPPAGHALERGRSVVLHPLKLSLASNEGIDARTGEDGRFAVVAPPAVYWLEVIDPEPWWSEMTAVDLETGDVSGVVVTLDEEIVNPIPRDPPEASKIAVGTPDGLGEADIEGAPGAVPPLSQVLLVNLGSGHQSSAVADADGAFSARIFAPPGSAIMVKHGPAGLRWSGLSNGIAEGVNPLPGTILHVPYDEDGDGLWDGFADAGGLFYSSDDDPTTPNAVGAAWSVSGSIAPATIAPGGQFTVEGRLRLYSPELDSGSDLEAIEVGGFMNLRLLVDADGTVVPVEDSFMSTTLTPTGFPVQSREPAQVFVATTIEVGGLSLVGEHTAEGRLTVVGETPADLPNGIYRPMIELHVDGLEPADDWLAAQLFGYTYFPEEAALSLLVVDDGRRATTEPRVVWRLLVDDPSLGVRGCGAAEDGARYELATEITAQGSPYVVPRVDEASGEAITYRLEPFLPTITFTDRRIPTRPSLPLRLPGGRLEVSITGPDGTTRDLGSASFAQSFNRTPTTAAGWDLNPGTTQLDDVYSLTTLDDRFSVTFAHYGRHLVTMHGELEDVWGNRYVGGGSYELWVAHPLDLDPGLLPGAPLAVGDAVNPTVRVLPGVPADVTLELTLYPDSDPSRASVQRVTGRCNRYGVLTSTSGSIVVSSPGEYRIDLVARSSDPSGELFMGAMSWGGVVMTPASSAPELVAHGRRGVDCIDTVPSSWFVSSRDLTIPAGAVCHSFNPYYAGDILWSRMSDGAWGGDALLAVGTVLDTVGSYQALLEDRLAGQLAEPASTELRERLAAGELPLFSSTPDDRSARLFVDDVDVVAYAYRSSQRPGVRVREVVSDDSTNGGYWRLDTLYDHQPGVGTLGDQVNDFKLQFVGTVYRNLATGHAEYDAAATAWIFIPAGPPTGTRVMPPFAGAGNGGWTTEGGPILTLEGKAVDLFVVPTGIRPGDVLELGDRFRFAGHVVPPLPSQLAVTVTSPSGVAHTVDGEANEVGYFYDPADDLAIDEAGVWTASVVAWHDGSCSGGSTIAPYPSGGVLGGDDGGYVVYVPSPGEPDLVVSTPTEGELDLGQELGSIGISGPVPSGWENVSLDYTIAMPGVILEHGELAVSGATYELDYDPVALHEDHPNLDLVARESLRPGLADTVTIGLLLEGTRAGHRVARAASVLLQGEQVSVVGGRGPIAIDIAPREPGGRLR